MTTALAPLAVWDANDPDGLFRWHLREASEWAQERFPDRARRIHRAEFYLMDVPFAVLHSFAENDDGHVYEDPVTCRPAEMEPVTLVLAELPPKHLLVSDAVGQDRR